jgi:hypothetical protein
LIYFQGLHLTRASTAGYFEMMQTLAAVCITWGIFHATLHAHQVIAALDPDRRGGDGAPRATTD